MATGDGEPVRIVEAGLQCIPVRSQYAEAIRDVLRWYQQYPDDWQRAWERIEQKYNHNPDYRRFSCTKGDFNIDAKLNGAYIAMGLLYGQGDIERTIVISMRCGQDSDCNPSNAAGVLFTTIGYSRLPEQFRSRLDTKATFAYSDYTFERVVEVCTKLARQAVVRYGGKIERDRDGKEVWQIPVKPLRPSRLVQSWSPEPALGVRYSPREMARIRELSWARALAKSFEEWAPGWNLQDCGEDMDPGLRDQWNGKRNVFVTHPLNRHTACRLVRMVRLPAGRGITLNLTVGHHSQGDWTLVVRANGEELLRQVVGKETARDGWLDVTVDLSPFAGQEVHLELLNEPSDWSWEAGYWARIELRQ